MSEFRELLAISAVVFIALGVALSVAPIVGIWLGFGHWIVGKSVGALVVVFMLTGFLHVVAKGMREEPKDR